MSSYQINCLIDADKHHAAARLAKEIARKCSGLLIKERITEVKPALPKPFASRIIDLHFEFSSEVNFGEFRARLADHPQIVQKF